MKKIILTAIAVVALSGMLAAAKMKVSSFSIAAILEKLAVITWEKTTIELGKIPHDVPINIIYNLTNSGDVPLIIQNVQPTCGCTIGEYTKEPIMPGKKGYIKLTYNASTQGSFHKTATVTTNASAEPIIITFTGETVIPVPSPVKTN